MKNGVARTPQKVKQYPKLLAQRKPKLPTSALASTERKTELKSLMQNRLCLILPNYAILCMLPSVTPTGFEPVLPA
jgi:hypothetical protein